MTVQEVISRVQLVKAPTPPASDLIAVINDCEWEVHRKIVEPRTEEIEFEGYDEADLNTVLFAPRPFDRLYVLACLKEIARREGQETDFNNCEREYKEIFGEFMAWFIRTHYQRSPKVRSWWYGV